MKENIIDDKKYYNNMEKKLKLKILDLRNDLVKKGMNQQKSDDRIDVCTIYDYIYNI